MATEAEDGKTQEANIPSKDTDNLDLTIDNDTSTINESSVVKNRESAYKHGFALGDLYKLSMQFYKKEKENLLLAYNEKIILVALWKQISCGVYDDSKLPEVGYFDVIGNDRRKMWQCLGDMPSDEAKKQFCSLLEKSSSSYETYILDKKREIEEEIERKRIEEEERKRKEQEERERIAEQEKIRKEEEERVKLALEVERVKMQEEEKKKKIEENLQKEENPKVKTPTLLSTQGNGSTNKMLAPASLWTRPKLQEFINHVKRDASSVLIVGRGETVTIRVPTHENGSCLFWEFATDAYDVGFGVYFEWRNTFNSSSKKSVLPSHISVQVNESDNESITPVKTSEIEEEEEYEETLKPVVVNENENNIEIVEKDNVDEVLPVLRRNSHEEVIVGSHLYPGRGIYLLKFDNSYSLLRSKTLYYRVYYTK